jgi:hypothetical protein
MVGLPFFTSQIRQDPDCSRTQAVILTVAHDASAPSNVRILDSTRDRRCPAGDIILYTWHATTIPGDLNRSICARFLLALIRCSICLLSNREHANSEFPFDSLGRWLAVSSGVMLIRLTRKLAEMIDGVDLSAYQVGQVLPLPVAAAKLLIAEKWAELIERRRWPRLISTSNNSFEPAS